MTRSGVDATGHAQPRSGDPLHQFVVRAQAEPFAEVRENEPAFTAWLEMCGKSVEKAAQHPTVRIEDRAFDRRTRHQRYPRWITDNERRAPDGKQVGLHELDAL